MNDNRIPQKPEMDSVVFLVCYGKWKFCEEDIRAVVGNNDFDLKIAVMADIGRTDYKNDILKKEDSVIDLVRTATYIHQIPAAIEMIQDAHEKGYETTVKKHGKKIGIHAHNNQQLAFANTIAALTNGASLQSIFLIKQKHLVRIAEARMII